MNQYFLQPVFEKVGATLKMFSRPTSGRSRSTGLFVVLRAALPVLLAPPVGDAPMGDAEQVGDELGRPRIAFLAVDDC
jgi:hypothetical protein